MNIKLLIKYAFYFTVFLFSTSLLTVSAHASGSLDIPTTGSSPTGSVTQPFLSTLYPDYTGSYYDQNDATQSSGTTSVHNGVDIQQQYGSDCTQNQSPIYAAAAGTVAEADWTNDGYGYRVVVDHGNSISSNNKYVFTLYGHMGTADVNGGPGTSCIAVSQNQTVTKGQLLGYQGISGNATGVHLHWSVIANATDDSYTDSSALYASPDYYTCMPLTVNLNNNPSPTQNVVAGENYCWLNTSPSTTTLMQINAIGATSPSNVWAVGWKLPTGSNRRPLGYVAQNTGTSWVEKSPPGSGSGHNFLTGVALNPNGDVWAAGYSVNNFGETLAYKYSGGSWTHLTSDNGNANFGNEFTSIALDGSNTPWAVGYYYNGTGYVPLLEKWNGTKFALQTLSLPSGYTSGELYGISFSSSYGWAVGWAGNSSGYNNLMCYFDGTNWSCTAGSISSGYLLGVKAISDTEVWAVGKQGSSSTPLIMHNVSGSWSEDTSFNGHYPTGAHLNGVGADSPTDVWIAGYSYGPAAFTMHYNGSSWSQITTPTISGSQIILNAVAAASGMAWSGGYDYPTGSSSNTYPFLMKTQ